MTGPILNAKPVLPRDTSPFASKGNPVLTLAG